jgi:uncharacterized membrane protein
MRRSTRAVPVGAWALAASGWLTLTVVNHLNVDSPFSPVRTSVVFAFVLACPGLAIARLLPLRERVEILVVAIALSISLGLLVSVAFTVARAGSTTDRLLVLASITSVAAGIDMYRSARRATKTARDTQR